MASKAVVDPNPTFDAVVVGAGLSGLVCASRLAARGLRTAVVEASSLVGGRALHALAVASEHKTVQGLAHKLGVRVGEPAEIDSELRFVDAKGRVQRGDPNPAIELVDEMNGVFTKARRTAPNGVPLAAAATAVLGRERAKILRVGAGLDAPFVLSSAAVGLKALTAATEDEAPLPFGALVQQLAAFAQNVTLNAPVVRVSVVGDDYELELGNGERRRARGVALCVPPDALAAIDLRAVWPDARSALQPLVPVPRARVLVRLADPAWARPLAAVTATNTPARVVRKLDARARAYGRPAPTLVIDADLDTARRWAAVAAQPAAVQRAAVEDALARAFPDSARRPSVVDARFELWRAGAFAWRVGVDVPAARRVLATPLGASKPFVVCGDAFGMPQNWAEAAVRDGIRGAAHLISRLNLG